ncbi:MAG TPA: alpha/beta fold hydrolase [Xanthomonadales bacterium]|nr:alpha/beta fold hydrolase [Xanthomonadales bacterium]
MRMLIALMLLTLAALPACSTSSRSAGVGDVLPGLVLRDIAVANGTIHVEVSEGGGAAVLLVHGGFGDRRMWGPQFDGLLPGARIVRMDLRGFGESSFPTAPYSATDDVLAVLDALAIAKAHIVGNSMGGALAIDFALAHPERVASLVVEASGPNGYPDDPAERAKFQPEIDAIVAVFATAAAEGAARGATLWKEHPMVAVAHADPRVAPLLHEMIDDNVRIFSMQHWPDDDKRAVGRLGELRVPTLFVVGDRDIALVRAAVAFGAARIAGARVETIAGTDHLPHLERPEEFNRIVRAFIDAHD